MRSAIVLLAFAGACATVPPANESLRIDGSPGVMPLVRALAAEYAKTPGSATVIFGNGLGSSARIDSLKQGRIDIALASHGINVADLERQGLKVHMIAQVPVGFGVHSSVPITNLSEAQICDIYSGRTTNWRQLGGPDLPIAAATRPKGEVDGDVVTAGIPCVASPHASVVSKTLPQDMSAFLAATPGAIGMTTTTVAGQSNGQIRLISIGGVAPTPVEVRAGRYRLTRESFLVTRTPPTRGIEHFLAFARSQAGARVITESGAIPR